MSSKGSKAGRTRARYNVRPKAAGRLGLLALLLALAGPALFYAVSRARAQVRATTVKTKTQAPVQTAAPAPDVINSASIQPATATTVNFKQLADLAKRVRVPPATTPTLRAAPVPGTVNDTPEGTVIAPATSSPSAGSDPVGGPGPALGQDDTGGPNVASPSPSQNFLAQEDGPKIGTTTFNIPPDTNGAVGLDKIFTNTNPNYRVHNKATGAALSTVSSDTFWASSGGSGFFDPQIVYDPYNQRWILAMASNSGTANSSIEIAVSQTSDPQGSYNIFRFVVGCTGGAAGCDAQGEWADFPMIGFNKNWIAVGMNMFQIVGTGTGGAQLNNNDRTLVVDYPSARANTSVATIFSGTGIGFCNYPVTTFSATENTLYTIRHGNSGAATYQTYTITGTPGAPVFTARALQTRPGGGWTQPGGDFLPQQCVPGVSIPTQVCPATTRRIDVGDAQVRSNPLLRNGRIWYSQTVALPAGSFTTSSRAVAQWTSLDAATGNVVDGGRVEDPTATLLNGGKHYAYPSLAVNKNNDVMMGFSEFESDDYADAGYTFRLGTDTAGTMRDPVIYKEGEDYYEKTFGGTRNRWGDYSHTLVDPINDRDMWTVQEYAQARTGATGTGSNDSRWGTWWAKVTAPAGAGELLISEFRLFGPNGPAGVPAPEPNNDEFIEIYNNNDSALTVTTTDGSAGYAIAASDGVIRCTIPNGTVIPGRGHYLCANSAGYSLGSYPAGNGTTATPDATYTTNIPNNTGIALFNTATVANFSTTTRLDAAGSTSEANTLYKEGTGYPAITQFLIDHSFYRDNCGKQGSTTAGAGCPYGGFPGDTGNNATDFVFVDTNGTSAGAGQRLGAPGPENLSSPVQRNSQFPGGNLDPAVGSSSPPNRVRDFTSDPANNSTFGTLLIRKTITNNTGSPVTRLRFRVIDQTTFPVPTGYADLRARTSSATPAVPAVVSITGPNSACPGNTCTVQQTTLETPPAQPNGGGFNSTLSAGSVTLGTPIAPGGQLNVQFLLGIQQTGTFRFFVNIEVLP
ncbi:MAG: hypothetical protein ACJ74T_19720 [Pyrinomonadaceae bacterium]